MSFRGLLQVYRYTPIFRLRTRYFMVKSMDSDRLVRKLGWFYVIFPSFSETVVRPEYQVDFRELYRRLWCYMVLLSCERSHSLAPRLVYYTYSGISPRIRSRKLSNRDGAQPQVVAAWWLPGRIPWPGWVRGGLGFLGDRETQGDPSLSGETNDSRHSVLLSVGFTELQISTLDGFSQTDLGYMDHPEQFLRDICRHGHSGNVWSRGHWTKGHWPLVRASVASVAE